MVHKFKENLRVTGGISPQIPNSTTTVTGNGVSLAKYNNFALACVNKYCASAGAAATFNIAQSTDNTTYSTAYLKTCTLASSTTADQSDVIEVRGEELSDGYTYVRGEVTMAATATVQAIAAVNIQFNPRFAQATLPA